MSRREIGARGLLAGMPALLCVSAALSAAEVRGQAEDGPMPPSARRLTRLFDFEEPGNPEWLPEGWRAITDDTPSAAAPLSARRGRGFPSFNAPRFDFETAAQGAASVRLPTRGGSVGIRLESGEIPVFPGADYQVSARVRTDGAINARAVIAARLLDQRGRAIAGSERRSAPLVSPNEWRDARIEVPASSSDSAWLQIDLLLLQPEFAQGENAAEAEEDPAAAPRAAGHALLIEDIDASAWFDMVAVSQIPRVEIRTEQAGGIARGAEPPVLSAWARDLGGQPLTGRVTVRGLDGREVCGTEFPLDPSGTPQRWTPALPEYGWYSAELSVRAGEDALATAAARLVWVPGTDRVSDEHARGITDDRRRFGVSAHGLTLDELQGLPGVLGGLGAGFVVLDAWDRRNTLAGAMAETARRRTAMERVLDGGTEVVLAISNVPVELAETQKLDPEDVAAIGLRDPREWLGYLAPTLDVLGQRITRYQVGRTGDGLSPGSDVGRVLTGFAAGIARLVPGPRLSVAWRAEEGWPAVQGAGVTGGGRGAVERFGVVLSYPAAFPAGSISEVLSWSGGGRATAQDGLAGAVTVHIELPEGAGIGAGTPLIELARRVIECWSAVSRHESPTSGGDGAASGAGGQTPPANISVSPPWWWVRSPSSAAYSAGAGGAAGADGGAAGVWAEPTPALAVMHQLIERLAGRRVVGTLPMTPGVRCLVMARLGPGGELEDGMLAAWNEHGDPARSMIDTAPLGAAVEQVDLFGNRRTLPAGTVIAVGQTPTFLERIDASMALFLGGFAVEPGFLPSIAAEHELTLLLSNPWAVRLNGQLQIRDVEAGAAAGAAGGSQNMGSPWHVSPKGVANFTIPPRGRARIPITLSFGHGQIAGVRDFVVVAKVIADREYPPVRLRTALEIGLTDLEVTAEARLSPGADGPDVVVTASVTNTGARSRTLKLESVARRQPTQQQVIGELAAGQTTVRRFVFRNAAGELSGRRMIVAVSDPDAAEHLNRAVQVP